MINIFLFLQSRAHRTLYIGCSNVSVVRRSTEVRLRTTGKLKLGFLCVLSICEVCFYQRFKASVSPLTQVEHKDKEKHQETDEDSPQSGAQHKHSRPSIHVCKDEAKVEIFIQASFFLHTEKK